MTELSAAIKTIFLADAPRVAALTGGIYTKSGDLGKQGVNTTMPAAAYQVVNGRKVLKPCCVLRVRTEVPTGDRKDVESQATSMQAVLEIYFYNESDFAPLRTAREAAYRLLQMQTLESIGVLTLINRVNDYYDPSLDNAATLRDEFRVKYLLNV